MDAHNLPLDQILQGDCISVMNSLPEKSVDLIFADPPYNMQLGGTLWRPNMTVVDAVDDDWDQFESLAAYDTFTRDWLTASRRILKDTGALWVIGSYHNIYRVGALLMDLDFWILNDIIFAKTNPMPNMQGTRFTNAHETMLWVQKHKGARYTFNYQAMKALNDGLQMRSVWEMPICSGKERLRIDGKKAHSTQKPEALLYRVIASSSNPGDVVLDPFFGTGTTGAVAKKLRRHWIGIERDATYIQVAGERIAAIPAPSEDESVFVTRTKRDLPRVEFAALLENGLLQPGQTLYFQAQDDLTAVVLANGKIRHHGLEGSIHQVGKAIQNTPSCNGWEHWYYEQDGQKHKIDTLRGIIREAMQHTEEDQHGD